MSDCFTWEKGRIIPTLPSAVLEEIINTPFPYSFDLYCAMMDIELKPWQRQECLNMIHNSKYLIDWGRGMSKTFLFVLVAVFFGIFGMYVIYLVPRVDELEQPMAYFNSNAFVDLNPHKKTDKTWSVGKGGRSMWYYIAGKPIIKISNIDDKGYNVSSGRFNVTMYDECALLMYYKREVELFNKANGMLMAMAYPHRIWASTPLIGSHFVTMKEDLEHNSPEYLSWRNFENTPNNFVTDTPAKMNNMLELKADATRQGILYAWETEYLALPRTASGAAFKNYIEEPFVEFGLKKHNKIGFDFHGYANGHIWVALAYNPNAYSSDIFVIAEGCERYRIDANADESMEFLKRPFFNCELYGEGDVTNMVNGPFLKAGQCYGMSPVSINGLEKYNHEANILNFTWHIDRLKTPLFFRDFTESEWADQNKFILHKESSGSKFRNHYIDAGMLGAPQIKGKGFYIPNKRLRRANSGIMEQERQRNQEGNVYF